LLLVNLIALAVGLHRKWIVPGWIYSEKEKERLELKETVAPRNADDRATIEDLQDEIKTLRSLLEVRDSSDMPHAKQPPRQRRRG
jgi:hypothetical protein